MKKVLLVSCGGLGAGGVQSVMMNIARNMQACCVFDIVLFTRERRHYDDEFEALGGKIFRIVPKPGKLRSRYAFYIRGARDYRALGRILRENGPYDVIHCNRETENGLYVKAAKKAGVPVRIAHTHVLRGPGNVLSGLLCRYYDKLTKKYATHKIGCSQEACMLGYGNTAGFTVVNNPYASDRFVYRERTEGAQAPAFLQVGSFTNNKNQRFSLEIIACLKNSYPRVHLSLVGFDAEVTRKQLEQRVRELGLEEHVTFCPQNADLPQLYAQVHYSLLPSHHEGFGIVAVESQAVGVRCFASDTVPRTTDCGGVTYLPLNRGPEYWAQAIARDFEKTGGRHEQYGCTDFSLETVMAVYEKLYGGEPV